MSGCLSFAGLRHLEGSSSLSLKNDKGLSQDLKETVFASRMAM
jgi:hypothetical protein